MREDEVLSLLSNVGQCYEEDLRLAMSGKSNSGANCKAVLDRLFKLGYIERTKLICKEDTHKEYTDIIFITKKGRLRLSNKREDNDYNVKIAKYVNNRFSSSIPKEIHKELANSRLLMQLNQVGVRVFPDDKPSLPRLYSEAKNKSHVFSNYVSNNEWMYSDFLDLDNTLSGAFYTKDEIRELIAINNPQDDDVVKGSRFKGIYFDKERICIVYQPNIYKNRTIALTEGMEKRTIEALGKIFMYFNYADDVDAIVLTNANALIVDMGLGGKQGVIKKNPKRNSNTESQRIMLLNRECDFFKNIYCFPHTKDGIRQLKYFVSHKKEDLLADTLSICDRTQTFTPMPEIIDRIIDQDLVIKNSKTGASAIYIPYYNIKQLKDISGFYEELTIITSPDMADRLSHIIRRTNQFFDIDGNPIQVKQYQKNGRTVDYAPPTTEPKKRTRKPKMHKISLDVTDEEYKNIKKITNYRDISVAMFLKDAVHPKLKEELKKYGELIELEEQKKKLIDEVNAHPTLM